GRGRGRPAPGGARGRGGRGAERAVGRRSDGRRRARRGEDDRPSGTHRIPAAAHGPFHDPPLRADPARASQDPVVEGAQARAPRTRGDRRYLGPGSRGHPDQDGPLLEDDRMTTEDPVTLDSALAAASVPALLMCLAQITGDPRWTEAPFLPKRDISMIPDPSGGLPEEVQQEVRDAMRTLLLDIQAGKRSEEHTSELQSRENLVCRL